MSNACPRWGEAEGPEQRGRGRLSPLSPGGDKDSSVNWAGLGAQVRRGLRQDAAAGGAAQG